MLSFSLERKEQKKTRKIKHSFSLYLPLCIRPFMTVIFSLMDYSFPFRALWKKIPKQPLIDSVLANCSLVSSEKAVSLIPTFTAHSCCSCVSIRGPPGGPIVLLHQGVWERKMEKGQAKWAVLYTSGGVLVRQCVVMAGGGGEGAEGVELLHACDAARYHGDGVRSHKRNIIWCSP